MSDVPPAVLQALAAGEIETVNLMEWLAADMASLARKVGAEIGGGAGTALADASADMMGAGVTDRLRAGGRAIAKAAWGTPAFARLARHKSDLVRQWACYGVNDSSLSLSLDDRLRETLPFAADSNMSVRETAWMAFRPHLAEYFEEALPLLEELALHADANIRRFAVEVTRPRSVWGAHLPVLKCDPERAVRLLDRVKEDPSRYVKLAVGNWLNDASKSRPDWVVRTCRRWDDVENPHTRFMTKRGLRTLARGAASGGSPRLPLSYDDVRPRQPMENLS
jgi:3-methyladenine DNA glycosylase AlkC